MHIVAVGHGSTRQAAEADALRQLVVTFGADIQSDQRTVETFRGVEGGAGIHHAAIDNAIRIAAGMHIIGAEIGDAWAQNANSHYALAVLERATAIRIYSEMLRANLAVIDNLTDMTPDQRNSFSGFARYQLAAVLADVNISHGSVLSVAGAPHYAQGLRRGDDFRRDMQEIAAAIPVGITVNGDRAGRIQTAFARALSELGFRTGGATPRYQLNVSVSLLPAEPSGAISFALMELNANLVDGVTGAVLVPYGFNIREGHNSLPQAETRAFVNAEQRIGREYGPLLSNYLAALVR